MTKKELYENLMQTRERELQKIKKILEMINNSGTASILLEELKEKRKELIREEIKNFKILNLNLNDGNLCYYMNKNLDIHTGRIKMKLTASRVNATIFNEGKTDPYVDDMGKSLIPFGFIRPITPEME